MVGTGIVSKAPRRFREKVREGKIYSQMRTHTPTSDVQLWRVIDTGGLVWPIYATPSQEPQGPCFFVELAIPAENEAQWKFISEILNANSFDCEGQSWLVRQTILEKIAKKCEGITPAYYLRWPDSPLVAQPEKKEFGNQPLIGNSEAEANEFENFVRYCAAESGITDVNTLRLHFALLCKSGMTWLMVKRKVLNLGFCKLYALPLRKDFTSILAKQWPEVHATFRRRKLRMGILEACGFIKSLHNTELIEMQTDETIGWSIHAVEEKPIERYVEKIERETLLKSTPSRYVFRLGNTIRKSYVQIVEVMAGYLAKTRLKDGYVDQSVPVNQLRLSPKVPPYRHFSIKQTSGRNGVVDAPVEATEESESAGEVDAVQNENLPTVPNEDGE